MQTQDNRRWKVADFSTRKKNENNVFERKWKKNNSSNLITENRIKELFCILKEKCEGNKVNYGGDQSHNRECIGFDSHLQCSWTKEVSQASVKILFSIPFSPQNSLAVLMPSAGAHIQMKTNEKIVLGAGAKSSDRLVRCLSPQFLSWLLEGYHHRSPHYFQMLTGC